MKAYQVIEFGKPIEARDVADPEPTGKEVVVSVSTCGLCHSDVHFHEGHLSLGGDDVLPVSMLGITTPTSLGHEIHGTISAFGPESGLSDSDLGRSVVVYPWIGCGNCEACLAERDNECPTPRSIGMQVSGGHAEKVVVREPKYLVDAQGLDPKIAGIYACSGLSAYAALKKVLRREGWVVVIGAGGVGLMAVSLAKSLGFSNVAVVDIDDAKLEVAKNGYGADLTVNSKTEDAAEAILKATGGAAAVVDFVGSEATAGLAPSILKIGGTYVNVGLFGGMVHLPLAVLTSRQLSVRGSYVGSPQELRDLIELVRAKHIKPIPVSFAPIDTVNDGIAELRSGKVRGRLIHVHAPAA